MGWVIGIDEAGYGPNLGPFVMTAVALHVEDESADGDLWQRLVAAVRRDGDPDDGRLLVADSKVVYSPGRGLRPLETTVLAAHAPEDGNGSLSLQRYLEAISAPSHPLLRREPWYSGTTPLPVAAEAGRSSEARGRFGAACRSAGVSAVRVRGVVICPQQFNALAEAAGSKGAVLHHGLAELVRTCRQLEGDEALTFFIDKHGGRNTYAAMLQDAIPDGMVLAHQEGMARSVYGVAGLKRAVRCTFQPRADAEHFPVALASMVSKYVREVLMGEFNRFWLARVPGLRPTAGYPLDARRYYDAIRPTLGRLGLVESAVWRRR